MGYDLPVCAEMTTYFSIGISIPPFPVCSQLEKPPNAGNPRNNKVLKNHDIFSPTQENIRVLQTGPHTFSFSILKLMPPDVGDYQGMRPLLSQVNVSG
jgi:hypothetical protein